MIIQQSSSDVCFAISSVVYALSSFPSLILVVFITWWRWDVQVRSKSFTKYRIDGNAKRDSYDVLLFGWWCVNFEVAACFVNGKTNAMKFSPAIRTRNPITTSMFVLSAISLVLNSTQIQTWMKKRQRARSYVSYILGLSLSSRQEKFSDG